MYLASDEVTVLLQGGARIEGYLQFEGIGRIDGVFKGEIFTPDTLIIGKEARVEGQIEAKNVIISGRFEGKIYASGRVELEKEAVVKATIESSKLHIEEGALFEGDTKMVVSQESVEPGLE